MDKFPISNVSKGPFDLPCSCVNRFFWLAENDLGQGQEQCTEEGKRGAKKIQLGDFTTIGEK